MQREAGFSGFVGETFSLLGDTAAFTAAFVAILGGLNAIGVILGLVEPDRFAARIGFSISTNQGVGAAAFQFALVVVEVLALYFLASRMLEARNCLRPGGTRIWAYVGLSILSVLGVVVGMLLLIVPGIIVLVRWSAATGFVIGAREGVVDSLGASWNATRGYSWSIFFAGVVLFLGVAIVSGAINGFLTGVGQQWPAMIVSSVVDAASSAIFMAFGIGIYVLLGATSEELGEVFE